VIKSIFQEKINQKQFYKATLLNSMKDTDSIVTLVLIFDPHGPEKNQEMIQLVFQQLKDLSLVFDNQIQLLFIARSDKIVAYEFIYKQILINKIAEPISFAQKYNIKFYRFDTKSLISFLEVKAADPNDQDQLESSFLENPDFLSVEVIPALIIEKTHPSIAKYGRIILYYEHHKDLVRGVDEVIDSIK